MNTVIRQDGPDPLPTSLLSKLFDATGTDEGGRGFFLFFIDKDGNPCSVQKFEKPYIQSALMKTMESIIYPHD